MLPFWCSFVTTLALLAGALWTGWRARRRAHLWLAPLAIVALAVTVVLTERLLRAAEFPQQAMRIHLAFAKTAAVLVVPVILSGLWLLRRPRARRLHLVCVGLFLALAVAATGTGIWVFSLSTPR